MPGTGRCGLRRRAVANHDIAGPKFGLAQRLAQLRRHRRAIAPRSPGAPPTSAPRSCSPVSDTSAWTGPAGSTSSENRARHTRLAASTSSLAAVARNLELRHRRALRRDERNLEIPARRAGVDFESRAVDAIRQRGHLQQASAARSPHPYPRADDARSSASGASGAIDGRCDRLRRRKRAAKWRRRRIGVNGDVVVANIFRALPTARAGLPSSCSASCSRFKRRTGRRPSIAAPLASALRPAPVA